VHIFPMGDVGGDSVDGVPLSVRREIDRERYLREARDGNLSSGDEQDSKKKFLNYDDYQCHWAATATTLRDEDEWIDMQGEEYERMLTKEKKDRERRTKPALTRAQRREQRMKKMRTLYGLSHNNNSPPSSAFFSQAGLSKQNNRPHNIVSRPETGSGPDGIDRIIIPSPKSSPPPKGDNFLSTRLWSNKYDDLKLEKEGKHEGPSVSPRLTLSPKDKGTNKFPFEYSENSPSGESTRPKEAHRPTILKGSRSSFPPTMPDQVLCKENQRNHMAWQRQKWMAERERALQLDGQMEEDDCRSPVQEGRLPSSTDANYSNTGNLHPVDGRNSEEIAAEVDDLLNWVDGLEISMDESDRGQVLVADL
jgi:hypothetical protein